jgi:hypothetical protein
MATSYSPKIVTDGLVLCLDAADKKSYSGSGTAWTDRSGNGNNGTLTNGPSFNSEGYITFAGDDDHIPFTCDDFGTDNTVEMWARWHGTANRMFCAWSSCSDIWTIDGNLGFNTCSGDLYGFSASSLANSWHHFVFVFKQQIQDNSIYVDGVSQTLSKKRGNTNLTSNRSFSTNFRLGGWTGGGYYYDGDMAIAKVYNRELTASEAIQNYNATKGRFGL